IRAALGASPGDLVWAIVRQGVVLTVIGVTVGLGISTAAARGLSSLLYRVSPLDLPTFAGAALLIGGGAFLTMLVATWQARKVDPIAILRSE
ncbi:MAG: FtsX-like permease family protein, partial [Acidobacteria bacterium]|nr:FtsX-like permease family protein [Acidobacteriota bacterium]